MNTVEFTYQRNKKDILTHMVWHRMIRNKVIMALNLVFPLSGIAALIMSFGLDATPVQYIAILYLISYPLITYYLIKLRINSIFKNPDVEIDVTTFTYSAAGINVTSIKGAMLLEWDRVFKVYETKEYIYVYLDRTNSLIVNKIHIGESQTQAIKEIIKEFAPRYSLKLK